MLVFYWPRTVIKGNPLCSKTVLSVAKLSTLPARLHVPYVVAIQPNFVNRAAIVQTKTMLV